MVAMAAVVHLICGIAGGPDYFRVITSCGTHVRGCRGGDRRSNETRTRYPEPLRSLRLLQQNDSSIRRRPAEVRPRPRGALYAERERAIPMEAFQRYAGHGVV